MGLFSKHWSSSTSSISTSSFSMKPSLAIISLMVCVGLTSAAQVPLQDPSLTIPHHVGETNAKCDCSYHKGGCTISKVPPKGYMCKCVYKGFWTCSGYTLTCDPRKNSKTCPGDCGTKECCKQAGGNCGGY